MTERELNRQIRRDVVAWAIIVIAAVMLIAAVLHRHDTNAICRQVQVVGKCR